MKVTGDYLYQHIEHW